MPDDITIRRTGPDDLPAVRELGGLAFGAPPQPSPDERPDERPATRWGAFDTRGHLRAKATDLHQQQVWGGREVPTCGVAGVAAVPEHRGGGLTRRLLTDLLHGARERGAAVSALYCTRSAVYRALGWETTGALRHVDLPTLSLRGVRPVGPLVEPAGTKVTVRPGTPADLPLARAVYAAVTRSGNGLLTRAGTPFTDDDSRFPPNVDGLTLAEDETGPVGYATWERGEGYGHGAVLTVHDLLALTPRAAAGLLEVVASWETVTPTVRVRLLPWVDAVQGLLPLELAREHSTETWMHRPVDVTRAVASRGWPPWLQEDLSFRLVDPLLAHNDGAWRLQVAGGVGELHRVTSDPDVVLHVRGWSLLWCAAAGPGQLRQAGLLADSGSDVSTRLGQVLGSGGQAALMDYF